MQEKYRTLSSEELAVMYQATQNEEILQELIIRNKGLICIWVVQYHTIPYMDNDDLQDEAYIALWSAAKSFNPNKGCAFTTLLRCCVAQRFNRLYSEATRKKRYNGMEATSYEGLVEVNREKAVFGNQGNLYTDDHSRLDLDDFLESLSGKAKTAAQMLIAGYTKGDVAKALKCTPATANYYFKRLQKAYTVYMAG